MLAACIGRLGGQQEDNWRNPPRAADPSSPASVRTRVPRLSSASRRTCFQKRGRRRSVRDSAAAGNRAWAGEEPEAVPGDRPPRRGRTQPQYRKLSTGCPGADPGVGR